MPLQTCSYLTRRRDDFLRNAFLRNAAASTPGRRHAGFTLVESLVALTLMMLAGAAILLSVDATVSTSEISMEETIAGGMAKQLVDEALGKRYKAAHVDPYQTTLGPSAWEAGGAGRERFDDVDDFNGFVSSGGAEGIWGYALGEGDDQGGQRHSAFRVREDFFADWRQEIEIYYVDETDLSKRLVVGDTSNYRAVEARVLRRLPDGIYKTIATARRVVAYIPPPN